jgi:rhodanese-related sulfurtransferase
MAVNFCEKGFGQQALPPLPVVKKIPPATLNEWLNRPEKIAVLDVSPSTHYRQAHIPGAWFVLRSNLTNDWQRISTAKHYVVTCRTGILSQFVATELELLVAGSGAEVVVLEGGTEAWCTSGFSHESGLTRLASEPIDRYRRPYEGTDNPREAMQAYLDWEFGLVEQLARDGTHHFSVL